MSIDEATGADTSSDAALKRRVRANWNGAAPAWRRAFDLIEAGGADVTQRLIDLTRVQTGAHVLDVASGDICIVEASSAEELAGIVKDTAAPQREAAAGRASEEVARAWSAATEALPRFEVDGVCRIENEYLWAAGRKGRCAGRNRRNTPARNSDHRCDPARGDRRRGPFRAKRRRRPDGAAVRRLPEPKWTSHPGRRRRRAGAAVSRASCVDSVECRRTPGSARPARSGG